jgi:hypothetical protein
MNTYKLSPIDMQKEKYIIQQILINEYDPSILEKIKHKKKQQNRNQKEPNKQNSRTSAEKQNSLPNFQQYQHQNYIFYK